MKKKFVIAALAFSSIATLSSFNESSEGSSEKRPMFGSEVTGHGPCYYTGEVQADGTGVTAMEVETTTYVFWIGFPSTSTVYNQCKP
ncbi:hypothetical protein [Pedobacter agri]|uniref:hypothetical protein n=1 Tax=Pedobacter agri TaxID=454586 RepID=UPI00292EF7BC|nr:hypothetical protein [Pedobacter agri]